MKNFFRNIHLYLSLVAGLVIAIICFTGATLVFEKELQQNIYPERYKVAAGTARISVDKMVGVLAEKVPGATISGVKIFSDPGRTVEISYYDPKAKGRKKNEEAGSEKGKEKAGEKERSNTAFMNPYSGELICLYSQRNSFFFTMFSLHRWLLAGEIGKFITGVSTFLFLFILITGIVLWWPKNKKILQQRLTLKCNNNWKRLNHDLHIVLGFYTAIFLFAFAFTGLAWSFKWFNDAIYVVTNSENKKPEPPKSVVIENAGTITFDQVFGRVKKHVPAAEFYSLNAPHEADGAFSVTVKPFNAIHEKATDQFFFDQYSGRFLERKLYADRNLGQKVRATFYPVHVGSIGGLPGRIIAFLSCVAGVTFPVSGLILWLNRLRKKDKKKLKARTKVVS